MGSGSSTETIVAMVKTLWERRTWTQADLARYVGVSTPALQKRLVALRAHGIPRKSEREHPHVCWSVPRSWFRRCTRRSDRLASARREKRDGSSRLRPHSWGEAIMMNRGIRMLTVVSLLASTLACDDGGDVERGPIDDPPLRSTLELDAASAPAADHPRSSLPPGEPCGDGFCSQSGRCVEDTVVGPHCVSKHAADAGVADASADAPRTSLPPGEPCGEGFCSQSGRCLHEPENAPRCVPRR